MIKDINRVKFNKRVVLLVQSYPAFRLVYFLLKKNQKVLIFTTHEGVRKVCAYLKLPCVCPEVVIDKVNYLLPLFFKRNLESYLTNLSSRRALGRLLKYREIDFVITIVGMDRKILPAFLNLKKNFFLWDDSFYVAAKKNTNNNILLRFKNSLLNLVYRTNFSLHHDSVMANIPLTDSKDLPVNCINLSGEPEKYLTDPRYTKGNIHKKYEIVFLGDYDFYEMSRKCNIVKLISLIKKINRQYPNKVFYKPHPGSWGNSHIKYFGKNIIEDFMPIEVISHQCQVIITLGSASVLSLKNTNTQVIGIGNLVDMCQDLFEMSEAQGLKHVKELETFEKIIEQELK